MPPPGTQRPPSDVGIELGFQLQHPLARAHLDADDAVVHALHVQLLDGAHLVLVQRGDDDAATLEREVEFLAQPVEHHRALELEPGLQVLLVVVEAAMHDSGVGLGGAERNVGFLFHEHHVEFVGGQSPGDIGAADAGADDADVVPISIQFSPRSPLVRILSFIPIISAVQDQTSLLFVISTDYNTALVHSETMQPGCRLRRDSGLLHALYGLRLATELAALPHA